jgi:hypothetical protein
VRVRGVSDADIGELRRFHDMRCVNFCGGCARLDLAVTAAGLARLAEIAPPSLDTMTICAAPKIDDECLLQVARIASLRRVILQSCPGFTEKGLAAILRLPRLTYLDVRGCGQIDDGWTTALSSRSDLAYLGVAGTRLSANGISQLNTSLPSTELDVSAAKWAADRPIPR